MDFTQLETCLPMPYAIVYFSKLMPPQWIPSNANVALVTPCPDMPTNQAARHAPLPSTAIPLHTRIKPSLK